MGGAPAIASNNGAYIAGKAVKSIGSAPEAVKGGNPHPPSIESAWRLEPEFNGDFASPKPSPPTKSPLASPTMDLTTPKSAPPVPPSGGARNSEPVPATSGGAMPKEADGEPHKMDGQNGQPQEGDGQPKVGESKQNEDEIPLGYSPGSPVPEPSTTSKAASQSSGSSNKYDKFYHKSLGSNSI